MLKNCFHALKELKFSLGVYNICIRKGSHCHTCLSEIAACVCFSLLLVFFIQYIFNINRYCCVILYSGSVYLIVFIFYPCPLYSWFALLHYFWKEQSYIYTHTLTSSSYNYEEWERRHWQSVLLCMEMGVTPFFILTYFKHL